jgi:hypothetical protein
VRGPHSQRMSSAANAPLCNIRERKQCNLWSYFPPQQQLCGTRSCGKLGTRASDRTGLKRKAPREHCGKCGGRARQPRGQLTGCLWELPPAFACRGSHAPPRSGACRLTARHGGANSAQGTQGAPRKMRRQGAATPGATHRMSVGCAPSIRLPRQPRTAPLRRLPPHRSPWRRQFGARHPGSTAENAAAGRSNPGVHSLGVCGMCPQPPLAAAAAHRPAQALATCSPAKRPAPKIGDDIIMVFVFVF